MRVTHWTRLFCNIDSQSEHHLLATGNVFTLLSSPPNVLAGSTSSLVGQYIANAYCSERIFSVGCYSHNVLKLSCTPVERDNFKCLIWLSTDENSGTWQPAMGRWPGRRPQHWQLIVALPTCMCARARSSLLAVLIIIIIIISSSSIITIIIAKVIPIWTIHLTLFKKKCAWWNPF